MDAGSAHMQMFPPQGTQPMRSPPRKFMQPQSRPPPTQTTKQASGSTTRSPLPYQSSAEASRQAFEMERSFRNPDHSSHIMTELSALWKSGRFVDAAIVVGEVKIQAHRMVLFAASPYLRASFDNLNPATELRLKMPSDIKLDIVFQFLTYIYDGVLRLDPNNAASLLKVSLMLRMEHLTLCCREFMAQAAKQGLMLPASGDVTGAPLLVLVDHKPPDSGNKTSDGCTQTASSSEHEQPQVQPGVEFERVFGEGDVGHVHGGTQLCGSLVNIQSDIDVYQNYGEEESNSRTSDTSTAFGTKARRARNEGGDDDDNDAMPMMIIKNEHIDPGYELSLNPQLSDVECDDSNSLINQTLHHQEETLAVDESISDNIYNPAAASDNVPRDDVGDNVPETDRGDNVPEADMGDNVPEADIEDNVPKADMGDNVPEADIGDNVPETDRGDNVPVDNIGDNVPRADIGDNVPRTDMGDNAPRTDIGDNVPRTDMGDNVPRSSGIAPGNITPRSDRGDRVPETERGDHVPETERGDHVPETDPRSNGTGTNSMDGKLTSQSKSSVSTTSRANKIACDIRNDSRICDTIRPTSKGYVNMTSGVIESAANNDLSTLSHSEQSLAVSGPCDQSPPQFGTEEFLSSDFGLPMSRPTKSDPDDPV